MIIKIITYSTSTGLRRATTFLASIVLSKSYDMAIVGEYVLMLTIAQLLLPLLTLNVTVALTREAISNPHGAIKLMRYVWTAASLVTGLSFLLGLLFESQYWWLFGVALGASEAIFACGNSFFLGKERSTLILTISLIKLVGFIAIIGLAYLHIIDVYYLALFMVVQNYVFGAYFARQAITSVPKADALYCEVISPMQMLLYSIATLPHTVALWISISADRLFIGSLVGKEAVAQYIMSYTIAQSVMVVVSGVVSAMPPRVINDPDTWRKPTHVVLFLGNLAKVCFLATCLNLGFVYADRNYLGWISNLTDQSYLLVGLISSSFFFSVLYVFFAAYLYLNRQTDVLKTSAIFLVPLNLLIMYVGVSLWGQIGAAVGLLLSYVFFGLAYGYAASRLEQLIRYIWWDIVVIFVLFLLMVGIASYSLAIIDGYNFSH